MNRKVLVLSTVGFAAGLVYALESNRRKRSTSNRESPSDVESSASRKVAASSGANSAEAVEQGASIGRRGDGETAEAHQLDDHGTNQAQASQILIELRDAAFDESNEKLALALGRPTEEIEEWTNGSGLIDGDVVLKARALAIQRGVEVE